MEETILEMWMYWTRLRHQLNHCSQIIQNKVERSKNYEVLSKWMAAAKQRRLHRRNINKCFLRSRLKRETAVVQRWSIAKVSKKTLTRLGKLVGGHLHRSTSSRCFKLWRVFAGQKHTLQKGSSKLGKRIQLLRLEFTFQTWLQAFKNVLRLRQILGRSSQQCSIRLIRRGWNCFELNSKLRRQSQTKAASAKRHRSQVLITPSLVHSAYLGRACTRPTSIYAKTHTMLRTSVRAQAYVHKRKRTCTSVHAQAFQQTAKQQHK